MPLWRWGSSAKPDGCVHMFVSQDVGGEVEGFSGEAFQGNGEGDEELNAIDLGACECDHVLGNIPILEITPSIFLKALQAPRQI